MFFALAAQSFAADSPKLMVTTSGLAGSSTVSLQAALMNQGDDPVGELQIYVPSKFTFKPSPAVGRATVTIVDPDIDSTTPLALPGSIAPIGPGDSRTNTSATGCDVTSHQAAWVVSGQSDRLSYQFPLFLDPATGNDAQFGSYKLVACFPPPSQFGPSASRKFYSMSIQLSGFGLPASAGTYVWRSLWTPFAGNSTTLNTAGNVEAQSVQDVAPVTLTISSTLAKKRGVTRVALHGSLLVNGKPAANAIVALTHGLTNGKLVSLGAVHTDASGQWTKTVLLRRASYFGAGATIPSKTATCQASFGVPCVNVTSSATTVAGKTIHVMPR